MSNKKFSMLCKRASFRVVALGLTCLIAIGAATCTASHPAGGQPATQPARRVDLLAMGDWGEGAPAQKAVADAMLQYVKQQDTPFAAMLLCGDNFYVNLSGVGDPQWQTLFEQMYDPQVLKMPFYAVLGNHDYDFGKDIIEMDYSRLNPQSRFKMPGRWYRVDLPSGPDPMVTVLMLDSDRPKLSEAQWNAQSQWLEQELAKPRGAWTVCCAHHPLFSNGFAAGNGVLQHDWGTLFKKYKVDFYLCGHEHNLQHLDIPDWHTDFVMAGGGGAHSHPLISDKRGPFSRSIYGFVHFSMSPEYTVVSYIGTDDKPVHVYKRLKSGETTVLMTTRSDPSATQPLEIIQGLYDRIHGPSTKPTSQP